MVAEKDSLNAECIQLKDDLNSRQIQIDSLENQVKVIDIFTNFRFL